MRQVEGLQLPKFFDYYHSPLKLVATPDGGVAGWILFKDTGGWREANNLIDKVLFVGGDEINEISRDEFIQLTEHERGRYLSGDGPIFALYETVRAIQDTLREERRYPTPQEQALIRGVRRRTFVMFEEQLQQAGDPAADPTIAASAS
ncbi:MULTISPECIES: hypothetical protein [unclassified Micromonospora]|uniref:hypothetical protein n=1 Tax=unclassified Micromonospora TaxID=2617518 RepID=UPI0005BA3943|nr:MULTISPECIES: hypothetical protein [unclassified Micromonospora]MBP1781075.1 hypothetical protein [Micromonospora sp. HB375]MCK1806214.1 hypothetical protein [Micromonospora sp. R42106]MCK1830336.1 hypothetical protein [Micromonospora sp. R42003]MCK1843306.1 hypothetical protein [Micromonospora sp. R42004]MCM1015726.1 hypothetical protein [Micromonospora sp. XM-20-01]